MNARHILVNTAPVVFTLGMAAWFPPTRRYLLRGVIALIRIRPIP